MGKKTKRQIERKKALSEIEDTTAFDFIVLLGTSPIRLTEKKSDKIKTVFPIPREQCVLWADGEFDLRPSGIACTEKGIYIKTDEQIIKAKKDKQLKSELYFYQWDSLNPRWFIGKDPDENKTLKINEKCRKPFADACRAYNKHIEIIEKEISRSIDENTGSEYYSPAILASAGMESAGQAIFVEQKSLANNKAGHGELAEEANNIIDIIHGLDAKVIGRDNAKDGADRIVEGVQIQTKYYKSATGSVEACFRPQNGEYRYMHDGKPMQLEVPKDQYEKAVKLFEYKIKQGKVPGVSNPKKAAEIVRRGHLTYRQAVNISKPGTIESLAYDAATGAVTCSCVFGISFVSTMYLVWRKTGSRQQAIQAGAAVGLQMFGLSFAQHLLVSQIARTSLAQTLLVPSQYVVGALGYDASASIVNGIRALSGKSPIYGVAATKHLAKIMRSNAVTSAIAFAVFSAPYTYKLIVQKSSVAQYTKNLSVVAAGVVGGAGGAVGAGIAASKIAGVVGTSIAGPAGTAVGIAGGFVGGVAGAKVTSVVGDILYEGDIPRLTRLLNAMVSCLALEYLLSEEEIEQLIKRLDKITQRDFKTFFEQLQDDDNQEIAIRDMIEPHFEAVVKRRKQFLLPTPEEYIETFVALEKM